MCHCARRGVFFDTSEAGHLEFWCRQRVMNVNVEHLDRQLAGLTGRFADLGAKLSEAARELQDGGAPPSESLVDQLGQLRAQTVQLRGEVVAAAQAVGVPAPPDLDSVGSLEPLLRAIAGAIDAQRRRAALEQARKAVIEVLDIVLGVRHLDDEQFQPLVDCQMQARDLHATVMALNESNLHQAQELTARVRAFSDFLTMLEGSDRVDDERFAALEAAVSTAFGRPLAVAAARGRLLRPGQTPPPPPPPPVAEPPRVVAPIPAPEPVVAAPPVVTPEPQPVVAAAPAPPPPPPPPPPIAPPRPVVAAPAPPPKPKAPEPAPVSAPAASSDTSFDETAQWWLAAWARWSGWRGTTFPDAVREELAKYSYLLSVPMQHSHQYEDGLLSYGYSILVEHVEKQNPGCVGNVLNRLKATGGASVGQQIFEYLLTEGRLSESYPEFIKNVLLASLPEPGPWFDARIVHTRDDTRVFRRPTTRLGDADQKPQRFLGDKERFTEHTFSLQLPPLTARFVQLSAELKDAHGLEARLKVDGAPSGSGWMVPVPGAHRTSAKVEARPFAPEGAALPGIGRDFGVVWVAVFNPQPRVEAKFELGLTLKKDTKGMKK
jgi:outer membrane biosynthesis protein TonB